MPMPPSRLLPHAGILLLALLLSTCPRPASARGDARTLDRCEIQEDCADKLSCMEIIRETGEGTPCAPQADTCQCLPSIFVNCKQSLKCPPGEVCAINPNSKSHICYGCKAVATLKLKFSNPDDPACREAPSPRPSPRPLALAFDFCSSSHPCKFPYSCLISDGDRNCEANDAPCTCIAAEVEPCQSDDECPAREACATDITTNNRSCASCLAVAQQPTLIVDDSSSKCPDISPGKDVAGFPVITYPPTPNGRYLDTCTNDLHCAPPQTCRIPRKDAFPKCKNDGQSPCFCLTRKSRSCDTTDDCPLGETCAIVTSLTNEEGRTCVSDNFLSVTNNLEAKRFGAHPPSNGTSLTFDSCRFDWDCARPRRCTHANDKFGLCSGRASCFCEPLYFTVCETDADCVEGEVCAIDVGSRAKPHCVSRAVFEVVPTLVAPAEVDTPPGADYARGGLTSDPCVTSEDCKPSRIGRRECKHITEETGTCDGTRRGCVCSIVGLDEPEDQACSTSADCENGEQCAFVKDAVGGIPICQSSDFMASPASYGIFDVIPAAEPTVTPTPVPDVDDLPASPDATPGVSTGDEEDSDIPGASGDGDADDETPGGGVGEDGDTPQETDEPICIGADALRDFDMHELVFSSHRRASVLCDPAGSCATAGHMVVWQGTAMMMRTYCSSAVGDGCRRRVMAVNSPRMKKGVRVSSRTAGLHFTALAARFESRVEETVLSGLVHMGM